MRRIGFAALIAAACIVSAGCSSTTEPPAGEDIHIILSVSGGIAGVDWQVTLDGLAGRLIGDRCRANLDCDWEDGEVLAVITSSDVRELGEEFARKGFFEGEASFGTQCCDQFDYRLTWMENDFDRTVTGSDGLLPQNIRDLIDEVRGFVEETRS